MSIVTEEEFLSHAREGHRFGGKIVFTNGCFDVFHPGHLFFLECAMTLGDGLFVAVNSDESVRRLKGEGRPIFPAMERARMVASIRGVSYVTIFNDDTPERLIREIHPDVLVKGARTGEIVGSQHVMQYGGEVQRITKELYSTTGILERICSATRA